MFDQTQDRDRSVLYQISTLVGGMPDYVKEAAPATYEDTRLLPNTAFADEVNRRYPLHTKADTWLSLAYLNKSAAFDESLEKTAGFNNVLDKIQDACDFWGVDPSSATMFIPKEASDPGIRIEYRVGEDTKASTFVNSAEELTKVAEDIINDPAKYPYHMRKDVGRQVLAAAPRLNATFSGSMEDMLNKTSAYAVGDVSNVHAAIRQRQLALETYTPEIPAQLQQLKQAVDETQVAGLLDPDMCEKVAAVLDAVDRTQGLVVKYGRGLEPPERQIFGMTLADKTAFDENIVKLPSGQHAAKDMLMHDQTKHWVENHLGQKIASLEDFNKLSYRHAELVYDFTQDLEKQASCGCGGGGMMGGGGMGGMLETPIDMGELVGKLDIDGDEDNGDEYDEGEESNGASGEMPEQLEELLEGLGLPEELVEQIEEGAEDGATIVIKQAHDEEGWENINKDRRTVTFLDQAAEGKPLIDEEPFGEDEEEGVSEKEGRDLLDREVISIDEGQNRLLPLFAGDRAELDKHLSSPMASAAATGVAGATAGLGAGHVLDKITKSDTALGKVVGVLGGGTVASLIGYRMRDNANQDIVSAMREMPQGATMADLKKSPAYLAKLRKSIGG